MANELAVHYASSSITTELSNHHIHSALVYKKVHLPHFHLRLNMLLASVTDILFMSDEFWGNLNLGSLSKLVSTCKGFKADMQNVNRKKTKEKVSAQSVTERAIAVMMERRPKANGEWVLKFSEAKTWFMLQVGAMAKFCVELPEDNDFHLSEEAAQDAKEDGDTVYIRFLDAYRLTLKSGLKAAMQRRDRLDAKLVESATESLVFHQLSDIMRRNLKAAIEQLKKVSSPDAKLKKGIRLLGRLDLDVCMSGVSRGVIEKSLASSMRMRGADNLKKHTTNYKTLIARYKAHSVYCPEKITMDCLARLE